MQISGGWGWGLECAVPVKSPEVSEIKATEPLLQSLQPTSVALPSDEPRLHQVAVGVELGSPEGREGSDPGAQGLAGAAWRSTFTPSWAVVAEAQVIVVFSLFPGWSKTQTHPQIELLPRGKDPLL